MEKLGHESKVFHARVMLSLIPGRLVCDFDEVKAVLGWMTNRDGLFCQETLSAMTSCESMLKTLFPELEECRQFYPALEEKILRYGSEYGSDRWVSSLITDGYVRMCYRVPKLESFNADEETPHSS
jgi:hypothetical protein